MLSFDATFEQEPHLRLMRELFSTIFSIPKGHPGSKPFHDHVMSFTCVQGKVVVRHYKVLQQEAIEQNFLSGKAGMPLQSGKMQLHLHSDGAGTKGVMAHGQMQGAGFSLPGWRRWHHCEPRQRPASRVRLSF